MIKTELYYKGHFVARATKPSIIIKIREGMIEAYKLSHNDFEMKFVNVEQELDKLLYTE